jgi:hypothetical protein
MDFGILGLRYQPNYLNNEEQAALLGCISIFWQKGINWEVNEAKARGNEDVCQSR